MVASYIGSLVGAAPYLTNIGAIVVILIAAIVALALTDRIYLLVQRHLAIKPSLYGKNILQVTIGIVALFLILLNIPGISTNVLQLLGLVLGGIVAFSSSSIIANGMSGLLIRMLKKYLIGDMIEFEGEIGEVTEIGLFHTEMQTVMRKLVIIPNSVMLSKKFSNLSETGSIISAKVSIGYDIPRTKVEILLLRAAKTVNIESPWVAVTELGNYAATYQINGLLRDIGKIAVATSQLHKEILDEFAKARLEILSPMYNAIRTVPQNRTVMAKYRSEETLKDIEAQEREVENVMFEKAHHQKEVAKQNEQTLAELTGLQKHRTDLGRALKNTKDTYLKEKLTARLTDVERRIREIGHTKPT